MTMRKALARAPGAYGRATGPPTGAAPVLVIDDVPAGATTTLGRLTAAADPTEVDAGGVPGAHGVRRLLFRRDDCIRRGWDYPADWRTLDAAALAALSWHR